MTTFPLVINLERDYGMKVILFDPANTIADVIRIVTEQLVGVVVKPFPRGTVLTARRHGSDAVLPADLKIADAGFVKMETIDIVSA